jgi:ribose transport system substrate-binding protein
VSLPLIAKQTGRTLLTGSADLPPEALQAVKDGQIFALSSPEHWMKGYIALHLLIKAKRTCTAVPEGWWDSGNLLVDKRTSTRSWASRRPRPARRGSRRRSESSWRARRCLR